MVSVVRAGVSLEDRKSMAKRHAALSGGRLGECGLTFGEPAVDQAEKRDDQGGLVIQVDVESVGLTLSVHEKIFLGIGVRVRLPVNRSACLIELG
ncbi:hypothetical protein ASF81_06580 [Brevundimonas sp. Leaf168]|nr:hypothetical protein ASF81_06580 [Brevundimonas sp. Leaf168]